MMRLSLLVAWIVLLGAGVAVAQYDIAAPDGTSSLRLGALSQVQGEWLESPDGTATAQNIFLRRTRLLVGAKLGTQLSLFLETDSPNLGKAGADGRKNEATVYIQDLILTYTPRSQVKLDAGLLLLPLAYHTGQAATTLLGIDYGPYAFAASSPTNCRVGRDYGVQARGYLFSEHLELRGGVFQGVRGTSGDAAFRTFGRVAWHPFEPQAEYFYTGGTRGKRKLMSVGVSYDAQKEYSTLGADVFVDQPLGGGNAITAQADYWRADGGGFLKDLPRQDVFLGEAGLFVASLKASVFVQVNRRDFESAEAADDLTYQAGVAYWPRGDKYNVKVSVGRVEKTGAPGRLQVVAQLQMFIW